MDKLDTKSFPMPTKASRLLIGMVKPYKTRTFLFFFLTFLGIAAWTASPVAISLIITRLSKTPHLTSYIWWLVVLYFVLRLVDEVSWRVGEFIMRTYKPAMIERIRTMLFRTTLEKPHSFYVNSSSGQIGHWINQTTSTANEFVDTTIWNVWGLTVGLIISAFFLFSIHWSIGLLFSGWLILLFVFSTRRGKKFGQLVAVQSDETSKASGIVVDSISNHVSVRVFNARQRELGLLGHQQGKIIDSWKKSWWQNLVTNIVKGQSAAIISGIALALVLYLFSRGEVPIGGLVLFIAYFGGASSSLWALAWSLDSYYRNFGTIQNALDGLNSLNEKTGDLVSADELPTELSLTLENLSFAYPDLPDEKVLDSINLSIPNGQKIGVVGHSGAGKSTLVGLLLGFYEPTEGKILVNGIDITTKDPSFMRSISSFVPQDTNLFNRTVKENVIYASPDSTNEQLTKALKQAEAYDFIQKLPKGLDTIIGERGVKLSGGQRQRIAIARAILKNSPLLLLDEATSALDSVSEQAIQKSLQTLMQNRTALVIAHRLSTLKHLDRIIVIDGGKIVEQGNHEELIKLNRIYADLWKRQKDGFIVE